MTAFTDEELRRLSDGVIVAGMNVRALATQCLALKRDAEGPVAEIAAERRRQIEAEGWTAEHDDAHEFGQMARAAAWYALNVPVFWWSDWLGVDDEYSVAHKLFTSSETYGWPWDISWWKPKDVRRDLIRAAALIVAEIERLDRAALSASAGEPT